MIKSLIPLSFVIFGNFFAHATLAPTLAPTLGPPSACELGLVGFTLEKLDPHKWIIPNGVSARNFLGPLPARTKEAEEAAGQQGVWYWGLSFGNAPDIEDARKQDASHKFENLGKIPYIINKKGVRAFFADLTEETPKEIVQQRFMDLLNDPDTHIIEFADARKNGKKAPAQEYKELSKEAVLRMGIAENVIWYTSDQRGPRFHVFGWVSPQVVGVVEFEDLFRRDEQGAIDDTAIRSMFRDFINYQTQEGGTFTINTSDPVKFEEALSAARDQWRINDEYGGVFKSAFDAAREQWRKIGDSLIDDARFEQAVAAARAQWRKAGENIGEADAEKFKAANAKFLDALSFAQDQWLNSDDSIRARAKFQKALDAASEYWRLAHMMQQSRFRKVPGEYEAVMKRFEAKTAFSVEVRDKNGVLIAGEILYRDGNVITANTMFHWIPGHAWSEKYPVQNTNYAYLAKAASIAEALMFRRLGMKFINVGMVSPLTAEEGGKMIPVTAYNAMVQAHNDLGPVDIGNATVTVDYLPFSEAERATWVPPLQPPPDQKPKVVRPPRRPHSDMGATGT